jgi:hypothetical protein
LTRSQGEAEGDSVANLDFFAAEADHKLVAEFLFSSRDVRVFESFSEYDQDLREFHSYAELASAFPIGIDPFGNGKAVLLQLWSPSVMSKLKITRFPIDPDFCDGHTFRHRIDGGGLMQLYLGGVHDRIVTVSHFGHWSQAGARKWGKDIGVDWDALKTLSNRIQYHVRRRLAVARVPGRPVLPEAYKLARSGYALKEAAQTPWQYELQADNSQP